MALHWTTQKVAQALGQKLIHASREVSHITTDSRQVKSGSVFIAIKGDNHDGHQFIPSAIKAGAAAIISEEGGTHPDGEFFLVSSSITAIRQLAHVYRASFSIPFIGVVGAVGKTTTKELITSILGGKFKSVAKTEGSQNGFLGIPLTLLSLQPKTDIAVIEIGIDEIGAMEQHLQLVQPTHVILTKNGPEHLHQLKTVEIAAAEELKAFDWAAVKKIPLAINLSDEFVHPWFQKNRGLLTDSQFLTYSLEKTKMPEFSGVFDENTLELTVHSDELNASFTCPLPGKHNAHNLLAAITLSQFFKLSTEEIRTGLSRFKTAYGRTEIYKLANGTEVIGDYYNSNPTSLEAALNLLVAKRGNAECHAVLGDMLELGHDEERFHREVAPQLIQHHISKVWLYGQRMQWLKNELEKRNFSAVDHFTDHEALNQALASVPGHSKILVKGSRGMKMEKVLEALVQTGKKA